MAVYLLNENEISFPNPALAEENGLLAVGGDLSVDRLLLAYSYGIFPWYNPGENILWWCPKERFVIYERLFKEGFAVSVEAYEDGELAGGLYGVAIGKCFFGESCFLRKKMARKLR